MKKPILFSFLILGIYSAFSQTITLKENKIITKNETLTGWLFNVCDDLDYAKDDIKDFLKEKYDFKAKKNSKTTMVVPGVVIPNVSSKRGDLVIYAQHSELGNVMGLSFIRGYDIYLNSEDNEKEMAYFREVAKDFIDYHYDSYYSKIIDDLDKQLDAAKKDLTKKENNIGSMKKKEANLDKKLSKEEDDEKKNELNEDLEKLQDEIESTYDLLPALKEQVETLEEEKEKYNEELLDYQNEIKKL